MYFPVERSSEQTSPKWTREQNKFLFSSFVIFFCFNLWFFFHLREISFQRFNGFRSLEIKIEANETKSSENFWVKKNSKNSLKNGQKYDSDGKIDSVLDKRYFDEKQYVDFSTLHFVGQFIANQSKFNCWSDKWKLWWNNNWNWA